MPLFTVILFLVSLASNIAHAESVQLPRPVHETYAEGPVASVTIRTLPVKSHSRMLIADCLTNTGHRSAIKSCLQLLHVQDCISPLSDTLSSRKTRGRIRRTMNTCFRTICPRLMTGDSIRVCQTSMKQKSFGALIDFFATTTRQYFLHTNDIHGLLNSEAIGASIVWHLRR